MVSSICQLMVSVTNSVFLTISIVSIALPCRSVEPVQSGIESPAPTTLSGHEPRLIEINTPGSVWKDFVPTLNPYAGESLSLFWEQNSIYAVGSGTGVVLDYQFNPMLRFSGGYLESPAPSSDGDFNLVPGAGFNIGNSSALVQITMTPNENSGVGITYVKAYRAAGSPLFGGNTGTVVVNNVINVNIPGIFTRYVTIPQMIDVIGVSGYYQFNPQFSVNIFGTYASSEYLGVLDSRPNGEIWGYGLGLYFPDPNIKGNLGGLVGGVQPYLANSSQISSSNAIIPPIIQPPVHLEAFYKYQLTDNITITPSILWISNPMQPVGISDNVVGTIRTRFTF